MPVSFSEDQATEVWEFWTDGSCPPNPAHPEFGSMGAGVIGVCGELEYEWGVPLARSGGTNQQAEILAVKHALEQIRDRSRARVIVYCDSEYTIGCMTQEWHLKCNVDLIVKTRRMVDECASIRFVHVRGHKGIVGNCRCDELATNARQMFIPYESVETKSGILHAVKKRGRIVGHIDPKSGEIIFTL